MEYKGDDDLDLVDGDGEVTHTSNSADDFEFDAVVSALEEVVMHDQFQDMQTNFCERHCGRTEIIWHQNVVSKVYYAVDALLDKFSEASENNLEYTTLFTQYSDMLEKLIEDKLKERIPGYSIPKMDSVLRAHKSELSGDVFDMLSSLTDFVEFKELMLQHKRNKTSSRGLDLSITGRHV
eukprot:gene40331-49149_t